MKNTKSQTHGNPNESKTRIIVEKNRVGKEWWSNSIDSLSLRPFLAPCACSVSALLQFSSELHCQSCNAQSLPLPSKTLRGIPSLLTVSVWPLRERLGQSTVTVTVNRYRSAQAVAARECFTNVCRMFWQGALPHKFTNFKMQNDECHN
jgi:hypothetical protein